MSRFVCTFGGVAVSAVPVVGGYRCVTPPAPGGRAGTVRVDLERILVEPNATHPAGVTAPMNLYAMDGDAVLEALSGRSNTSNTGNSVQSRPLLFEYRNAISSHTGVIGTVNPNTTAFAEATAPKCDALTGRPEVTVDRCGVCGGTNTSVDCLGDCFGSAELCGSRCIGGRFDTAAAQTCKQQASTGCVPPIRTTTGGSRGGSSRSPYSAPYNRNAYSDGEGQQSLVLIAVLACTMVLLSVCMWIVRVSLVARLRNTAAGSAIFGAPEHPGLTPEQILTCTELLKDVEVTMLAATPEITCSICICEFEEGDNVRRLPCHPMHIYHTECVDQWFQQSRLCPMCKHDVLGVSASATAASAEGDDTSRATNDDQNEPSNPTREPPQISMPTPTPTPTTLVQVAPVQQGRRAGVATASMLAEV